MRGRWTGLGLLLVVPWLTQCTTGRLIRLETGEGPPLVYTPASPEPPPIEIPQQVFLDTLTDLLLTQPLTIHARPQGRIVWASWGATQDTAQQLLLDQCEPSESADDCLRLPSSAPPPGTLSRMRLAFSLSLDSLWEGATIPMTEYADPMAFKVMVYSAMITWLVILMAPEPVTKALAALLTLCLVAYIGLGPVWSMMKAGWQFAQDCERATTAEQLKLAGQRFNLVLGDNGMRIFLLLATAAIGGRASFLDKGPRLPAFSRAAAHASKRTGVNLRAMAQVRTVTLAQNELVIGLAPGAVAAMAMGPGGKTPPSATSNSTGASSASDRRVEELLKPGGRLIGSPGTGREIRIIKGDLGEAQKLFDQLSAGGTAVTGTTYPGTLFRLPSGGTVGLRTVSSSGPPTIDVRVPGIGIREIKFTP